MVFFFDRQHRYQGMKQYKIALVQANIKLYDTENNVILICEKIRQAAACGAKLICFPEGSFAGYDGYHIDRIAEMAARRNGRYMRTVSALAAELGVFVLIPFFCKDDDGTRNCAFLIDDSGKTIASYTKTHLIGKEKDCLIAGDDLPVWDTPLGRIGCLICYDVCFPETSRILAQKGAQLLLVPAAWRGSSYFTRWWELNIPCRALDNLVYVAAVNRTGTCKDDVFAGRSMICGPDGSVLSECKGREENIIYADIDIDKVSEMRRSSTLLDDMRPDLYKRKEL